MLQRITRLFRKKSQRYVGFYCLDKGTADVYPVLKSNQVQRKWVDYVKKQDNQFKVTNCPAIASLINVGWVMQAPCDFRIKGSDDGNGFSFEESRRYSKDPDQKENARFISAHAPYQSVPVMDNPGDKGSLNRVVKLEVPWVIEADPNTVLLQCPVPYVNESRFTAAMGIIDPQMVSDLNVQIFWHNRGQNVLVSAGTPLCAYIPLDRSMLRYSSFDQIVDDAPQRIIDRQRAINTMLSSKLDESHYTLSEKIKKLKVIMRKYYGKGQKR